MRALLSILAVTFLTLLSSAQSRAPEIKIQPRQKVAQENPTGKDDYEERPYFILIEQSEKALAEGDYEAAAMRLTEAMAVEPDNQLNVALLSNLGMIYFYDHRDSLALQVLDKAIERSPRLITPHEGRARVLLSNGRDSEAFDEYSIIIGLDSLNTDARFVHGMMALYRGDLSVAEADIAVLESVVPVSRSTMLARATMSSMTGKETEAISLFRKLIEIEPAAEYYARLVACLLATENLGDASDAIGKCLEQHPDDPEMYYYRAILNKKRYLPEDAKRDAKRALELGVDPERIKAIFR